MNRTAKIAIGVVLVLLLAVASTYGWRSFANRRKLHQLQAKASEMLSKPPSSNSGGRARFEGFREMREEVRSLPEAYQQQFRQSMGNMFQRNMERQFDEYLALDKVERKKYLDKKITEDEKRRKEREARNKQRQTTQARNGSTAGGNNGGAGSSQGGPQNSPPGGGRGRWGNGSLSTRLDNTSPQFRAKFSAYRRDMEQRRKERGLPADRGGRR
jgi:hypothetical protein